MARLGTFDMKVMSQGIPLGIFGGGLVPLSYNKLILFRSIFSAS